MGFMTAQQIATADKAIRETLRLAEYLADAETAQDTYELLRDVRNNTPIHARIMELLRTEVLDWLRSDMDCRRRDLLGLGVNLTDAEIGTHVREHQARIAKWKSEREADASAKTKDAQ
jgi:hypothetical protein